MATAPTPGGNKQALGKVLRITMHERSLDLNLEEFGPGDGLVCRQQTGMSIDSFMADSTFSADSLVVLWWLARRKNGEPNLQFATVLAEYPTYADLKNAVPGAEMVVDGVGEASGPDSLGSGPTLPTSSDSTPET